MLGITGFDPVVNALARNTWRRGHLLATCMARDHKLICIHRGGFQLRRDGVDSSHNDRSFVIIPPGCPHSLVATATLARTIVHFDWSPRRKPPGPPWNVPPGNLGKGDRGSPCPRGFRRPLEGTFPTERAETLLGWLFECWNDPGRDPSRCNALLATVLVDLLYDAETPRKPLPRGEALAQRIRESLEERPYEDLAMAERLAAVPGSREHLCRVFRTWYGTSPQQHLAAIRVEQAKLLLEEGDLSVAAIARRVGFATPAWFGQVFRRLAGETPGSYRQRCLKPDGEGFRGYRGARPERPSRPRR